MRRFNSYMTEFQQYKYACLAVPIHNNTLRSAFMDFARAKIDVLDLAENGYEDTPHITVMYGNTDDQCEEIIEKTRMMRSFDVTFGEIKRFEQDTHDVLYVEVLSGPIHKLHLEYKLRFPAPGQSYKEYRPHVTLAYVKPGAVSDLDGHDAFAGKTYTVQEMTMYTSNGQPTHVPLLEKDPVDLFEDYGSYIKVWYNGETKKLDYPGDNNQHHLEYAWTRYKFSDMEQRRIQRELDSGRANMTWNKAIFDILFKRGYARIIYLAREKTAEIHCNDPKDEGRQALKAMIKKYPLMNTVKFLDSGGFGNTTLEGHEEIDQFIKYGTIRRKRF